MEGGFFVEVAMRTESSINSLLFLRFTLVGRASDPALRIRVFTLFGIRKLQIPFHTFLVKDKSEVFGLSFISLSMISL